MSCIAYPFYTEEGYPTWDELIAEIEPLEENVSGSGKLTTIIYTSGTGMPKG